MRLPQHDTHVHPAKQFLPLAALITAFGVFAFAASTVKASDSDLFSEINMSEVVNLGTETKNGSDSTPKTLLGANGLSQLLKSAELNHQKQNSSVVLQPKDILTAVPSSTVATPFPFQLTVDPEAGRLNILLPIQKTDTNARIDGAKLMQLLVKVSKRNGLSLSASSTTIGLRASISNRDVEVNQIKEQCLAMINVASEVKADLTQIQVSVANKPATKPTAVKPATAPPTKVAKTTSTPTLTIDGTWSARVSNDNAWAVAFGRDGKYTMVHTKNRKNSISKGTYLIKNQTLTLSETGAQSLSGKIAMSSQSAFSWSIAKPDGTVALQLNFNKKQ